VPVPMLAAAGSAGIFDLEGLVALLTLTALEIVLGIDNVIFIAVLAGKLPAEVQERARRIGISVAVVSRILLLLSITWVMTLKKPLFSVFSHGFTGKDLILIAGGLFLIAKATFEIHDKLEGTEAGPHVRKAAATLGGVVVQILLIDVVFSLDSVITAVGMSNRLPVMILAVLIAAGVMLVFSRAVSQFVERHPTMKMLALAFLILIGVALVTDGFGKHIEKGYIYFAMSFSFFVELLNTRLRSRAEPVQLRHSSLPSGE